MEIINKLDRIRKASGNAKIALLSKSPELKEILEWTYNPHKKYYITAPNLSTGCGTGFTCHNEDGSLEGNAKVILEELSKRNLSGNLANETISDYLVQLTEDQSKLFQGIINKDLKLGIHIRSINKVWPGLIPTFKNGGTDKPAIPLCKTFPPNKAVYPLLVSIKYDGVRGRSISGEIFSRSYKKINGMDHIEALLEKIPFDVDGEIVVPGSIFDSASGLIRNLDPVPEAVYMVFDGDLRGGKYERYLTMNQHLLPVKANCPIQIVKQNVVDNEEELMEYYQSALDQGFEGIVACPRDGAYEDKRIWWRLVPIKTADCICTGVFEGKGKYENSAGGIYVDFDGHQVKVGTGFTDSDRKKFWEAPEHYTGLIGEFEYKEKTKAGSMRQPRFKGWRLDKSEPNFD